MNAFRRLFEELGRELKEEDAVSAEAVTAAEMHLEILVPSVLREFYETAGNADDFVRHHHTLLAPDEWFVDQGHLVFWAAHQNVVLWGTPVGNGNDPIVCEGANNQSIEWRPLESHLREFLETMVLWQGAFGGSMPLCDTSSISERNISKLRQTWTCIGTVNKMEAFLKPRLAVCLLAWEDEMRVFVGGHTESQFQELAAELELTWEVDCWEPNL